MAWLFRVSLLFLGLYTATSSAADEKTWRTLPFKLVVEHSVIAVWFVLAGSAKVLSPGFEENRMKRVQTSHQILSQCSVQLNGQASETNTHLVSTTEIKCA